MSWTGRAKSGIAVAAGRVIATRRSDGPARPVPSHQMPTIRIASPAYTEESEFERLASGKLKPTEA